jgi:hypothetical protein
MPVEPYIMTTEQTGTFSFLNKETSRGKYSPFRLTIISGA